MLWADPTPRCLGNSPFSIRKPVPCWKQTALLSGTVTLVRVAEWILLWRPYHIVSWRQLSPQELLVIRTLDCHHVWIFLSSSLYQLPWYFYLFYSPYNKCNNIRFSFHMILVKTTTIFDILFLNPCNNYSTTIFKFFSVLISNQYDMWIFLP